MKLALLLIMTPISAFNFKWKRCHGDTDVVNVKSEDDITHTKYSMARSRSQEVKINKFLSKGQFILVP